MGWGRIFKFLAQVCAGRAKQRVCRFTGKQAINFTRRGLEKSCFYITKYVTYLLDSRDHRTISHDYFEKS